MFRIVHGEPDLGAVPADVRGLVEACLAKDPRQRPGPGPGRGAQHGDRGAARAVARRLLAARRGQGHPGAAGRAERADRGPPGRSRARRWRAPGAEDGMATASARPSAPASTWPRAAASSRSPTPLRRVASGPPPVRRPAAGGPGGLGEPGGPGTGIAPGGLAVPGTAGHAPRHQPPGPAHRGRRGEHRGHRRRGRLGAQLTVGGRHALDGDREHLAADGTGAAYRGSRCSSTTARGRAGRRRGSSPRATPSRPTPVPGAAWCTSRAPTTTSTRLTSRPDGRPGRYQAGAVTAAPEVVGDVVCLSTSAGHFYALRVADGTRAWDVDTKRARDLQADLGGRRRQRHPRHRNHISAGLRRRHGHEGRALRHARALRHGAERGGRHPLRDRRVRHALRLSHRHRHRDLAQAAALQRRPAGNRPDDRQRQHLRGHLVWRAVQDRCHERAGPVDLPSGQRHGVQRRCRRRRGLPQGQQRHRARDQRREQEAAVGARRPPPPGSTARR